MDYKQIENELINIEQSKRHLNNIASSIGYYDAKLKTPKSSGASATGRVQGSYENVQEKLLAELIDLKQLYEELIIEVLEKEARVYKAIRQLDFEEQNILIEKYIHGQTWVKVAKSFGYSESTIMRRRKQALKKLAALRNFFKNN